MFGFIRKWRRSRRARRPFPEAWLAPLEAHVPCFKTLEGAAQEHFLTQLKLFVWEKHFIGASGMEITDEVRVVVSAAAVRLTQHLDLSYYDRLTEIVIYPDHYVHDDKDGVILGEAQSWGTVVLSWPAVLHGLKNPCDGLDTAIHEFAHVLDRATGEFNGTPELRRMAHYHPWGQIMSQHFFGLQRRRRAERRVLRAYGAQNEAEFFAVATEAFFEKPSQMKEQTPELFEQLRQFYGTDPAPPACDPS